MEGRDSVRASPMLNPSPSTGQLKPAHNRKKDFDRRVVALSKEYQDLNPNNQPGVTLNQLLDFLKTKGIIDPERTRQIFDVIDEERTLQITKNQYIRKCFQIEDLFLNVINEKVSSIKTLKTKYEDAIKKLAEAKETERTNSFGIMEGSTLRIDVVEAKELVARKFTGTSSPFVSITVGDQLRSTKYFKTSLAPAWNEELTFDIVTGEEPIKVVVMDKDIIGGDDMGGYCELRMDTLRDQLMHDVWMGLKNTKGETISGKIHLIAQWIHSSRTFYADFLARIQARIDAEQPEKAKLEVQLERVREPFGIFINLDAETLTTLGKEEEVRPIATTLIGSFVLPISRVQVFDPVSDFTEGEHLLWFLLAICSILGSAFRFDIVNECIGLSGFTYSVMQGKKEAVGGVRLLIMGLGAALFHDGLWVLVGGYTSICSLEPPKLIWLAVFVSEVMLKLLLLKKCQKKSRDVNSLLVQGERPKDFTPQQQ